MNSTLITLLTLLTLATSSLFASSNDIANAIRDLGASDHKTREAATQFLSTAGKAAVPALEQASKSPDPEIRLRAAELLPAARLGLPPEFPAELRKALSSFSKAGEAEKKAVILRLAELGPPARSLIMELARSESNLEQRVDLFGPFLEPMSEELDRRLRQTKIDDEAVTHILQGVEFYEAILPEATGEIAPKVIQRLDAVGQKKAADDLFDRTYQQLEKTCLAAPKEPDRHNNIAWLCAIARRRLDDGLKHIEQALAETPGEAPLLDTQAELYFQKGNKERALELIEKAIERDPNLKYFREQRDRIKKGNPSVPPPELEQ